MDYEYDKLLKQVIRYLIDSWMKPEVGIVASGIFDPLYSPVFATSEQLEKGRWLHAERNVIQKFERIHGYGSLGYDSILVVTLSPCSRSSSDTRLGSSCLNFLKEKGIKRVHVGIPDPSQGNISVLDYERHGIALTLSQDQICKTICCKLYAIFETYGQRVNFDLIKIKKEINHHFFEEMTEHRASDSHEVQTKITVRNQQVAAEP